MKRYYLILLIGIAILSGCLSDSIVCNSPYIRFEDYCCLDENDDGVCDSDKPRILSTITSTTITTVIITTSSTTTTTSTTSTTFEPECYMNKDCDLVKNVCINDDVYSQRMERICRHPGTLNAICIGTTTSHITYTAEFKKRCEENTTCVGGECIYVPPEETTTTLPELTESQKCSIIENTKERDECYYAAAIREGSRYLCDEIRIDDLWVRCYIRLGYNSPLD
ncbi:MAG: hypothetical protein L6243_01785 [Candidatus Altiarchaeales archaeon]|nr:hypothetical protein [Candidatus Altiarchaeota archaeon]MBU4341854.1 hypothetical protein [Candidatus Altiarchaeota archaeon]MCG2782300.1 hypothetical protein [Candidatus Altiarchaeales archaeon]